MKKLIILMLAGFFPVCAAAQSGATAYIGLQPFTTSPSIFQEISLNNTSIVYLGLEPGTPTWTVAGISGAVDAQATTSHTLAYVCTLALGSATSFSDVYCGTGWGQDVTPKQQKARSLSVQDQDSATCTNRYWTGYELAN